MPPITLSADKLRATIVPELGAGIADFSIMGPGKFHHALMRRAGPNETNPSALASFFMIPWCNRIAGAKFTFRGKEHALKPNGADGVAQHGDVRARAWSVVDQSATAVTCVFDSRGYRDVNWPWPFTATAKFELSASALRVTVAIRNESDSEMPAGCGLHPYFPRRLWNDGDVLHVKAAVSGRYPVKGSVPTGPAAADDLTRRLATLQPWPETALDDVFGGFRGPAELRWSASGVTLRVSGSENMGHLVLFSPPVGEGKPGSLPYVALEPQSQVNNALNMQDYSAAGTVGVGPGKSVEFWAEFGVDC